jgi:cyclopropane fatty-acyl-phospholipid synthase-like methyltransferase
MTLLKDGERNESKYLHKFADLTNKRVLEIGCGEGRLTWQYAKETGSTIGIDSDKDGLRVAIFDQPSGLEHKVHFSQRIRTPSISSETFDLALFAWSF